MDGLAACRARDGASFDRTSELETDDGPALRDIVGSEDVGYAHAEDAATVMHLMRVLTAREKRVLLLRFGADLTQAEVGEIVGCTQMHVSRIAARRARQAEHRRARRVGGGSHVDRERVLVRKRARTPRRRDVLGHLLPCARCAGVAGRLRARVEAQLVVGPVARVDDQHRARAGRGSRARRCR